MAIKKDELNTAYKLDITVNNRCKDEINTADLLELPAKVPTVFDDQEASATETYEVADLVISYLEQIGVEYVFGIPGGAIEPLYNALARSERRRGIEAVVARHETGAAFMADGYTSVTGKLGVCVATTGPGATNLITGVSSAYENNIPMLVITAQTSLSSFGRGGCQESSCTSLNVLGMFRHCTRYNSLVSHVDQIERKICAAVMSAFQSPQGPSHLSIPLDILSQPSDTKLSFDLNSLLRSPAMTDDSAVTFLCNEMSTSKNSVFIIGDQCGDSIGSILDVAAMLGSKIVTPPNGKGLISPYHPLFRGVIGFAGHNDAVQALQDPTVDTIVAIGASLGEWECIGLDTSKLGEKLIHVASHESSLTYTPMARFHVRGALEIIFKKVVEHLQAQGFTPVLEVEDNHMQVKHGLSKTRHFRFNDEKMYRSDSTPIKPQRLMRELPGIFPERTRYIADGGNSFAWAIHYLHPYDRRLAGQRNAKGGLFRVSLEFASMAWGIGASIGMALGLKDSPVVCITGDGSYLMSGQEITTAIQLKLNVIFCILNDSSLGMVKHGQQLGDAESIGHALPFVDFSQQASSMGVPGYVINSVSDLHAVDTHDLCERNGPSILDVRIDPNEIAPMVMRVKMLH